MFEVYIFGGSLGEIHSHIGRRRFISGMGEGRLYGTYNTKAEATKAGKGYVKGFSGGSRNYYHPRYRIIEVEDSPGHIIFSQGVDLRTMRK